MPNPSSIFKPKLLDLATNGMVLVAMPRHRLLAPHTIDKKVEIWRDLVFLVKTHGQALVKLVSFPCVWYISDGKHRGESG